MTTTTILTTDGAYFDFLAPDPTVITLNAVARGLANICRFGGQCRSFYSVAEHSVHVSHAVPPEHARWALLHDAAEAFIGDMVKPLKMMLGDYQAVEERVEAAVAEAFGLDGPMPEAVKAADRAMLRVEQQAVMGNRDDWAWTEEWDIARFGRMPVVAGFLPDRAYRLFVGRAQDIGLPVFG